VAKADKMRVNLNDEMFVLAGHSRVDSLPGAEVPMNLAADRTVYERKQRLLRVEGNASLRRGQELVRAKRMSANLTEDESGLNFVRAQWNVGGRLAGSGDSPTASVVRFTGRDLQVVFQQGSENQARKVELSGGENAKAMIETVGAGAAGVTRTLTALRVEGQLAQGVLTQADAFGGVELRETSRGAGQREVRRATGLRADAAFRPDGQIASVNLHNEVTFRDATTRATGDRASLDLDSGRGEFFGDPVEAISERGRMTAPRILYNVENQILNATGGVRAVMEQASDSELAGTPLGEGEGPVHVESREAFWRKEPQSFLFRGDVRAWRGENLMLTTELKGDQAQDRLTAAGGVKTLWIPASKDPKAKRAPVEVVAQEMVYLEGGDLLTYTGSVRVVQEGKTLTCDKLDVELTEENRAKMMICNGDAHLNDPKAGRQIAGEKAVYDLAAKRMEITGDKVTMKDRDGNQVQGKRVIYSVDDGKVEVKGKNDAPAVPAAPATGTGSGRG
jgi:lipopolysaccharide transport protein LptA